MASVYSHAHTHDAPFNHSHTILLTRLVFIYIYIYMLHPLALAQCVRTLAECREYLYTTVASDVCLRPIVVARVLRECSAIQIIQNNKYDEQIKRHYRRQSW